MCLAIVISANVGFVVVELEVDLRAEHLQIGDQCIGLGDLTRIAVEIARRPRCGYRFCRSAASPSVVACAGDIRLRIRDHVAMYRHAESRLHFQIVGDMHEIELGARQAMDRPA